SVIPDSDGVIRTTRYAIGGLKTFGVVVAGTASGRAGAPGRFAAAAGGAGAGGAAPIDYAGPPGTVPTLSYSSVLDGRFPRAAVAGRIVIVGVSAPSLQDLHQTP